MTVPVVGLDLSTTATGVALTDGSCRTIRPQAGAAEPSRRLHEIVDRVAMRVKSLRPLVVVLEGYGYNSSRLARNAELGGAIRLLCFEQNIPYIEIAPNSLKLFATGNGHADKDAMVAAARAHGATVANDNEADAWWLWCAAQQRYEHQPERPALTTTLLGLAWPELRWNAA